MGFTPTTPQSAAGWRIEPPVSEPRPSGAYSAATAAAEPPLEPPGTRVGSRGLRVGPNAEFSVDDPIANSSKLVLAIGIAPGPDDPLDDGRGVGRTPPFEDPRRARGGHAAGAEVVFEHDGDAGERARILAAADRGVERGRRCPRRLVGDQVARVQLRVACGDDGQVLFDDVGGRPITRTHEGGELQRGHAHGASRMRGNAESVVFGSRGHREHLVAIETRVHLIRTQHVDERQRMRCGRHVVGVEGGNLLCVLEDHAQLDA